MVVFRKTILSGVIASLLSGCAGMQTKNSLNNFYSPSDESANTVPALEGVHVDDSLKKIGSSDRQIALAGVAALKKGKFEDASKLFNVALKLNVTNSELHYLNALAYHLMALQGNAGKFELAEEGYRLALHFEPSNWQAEYQLGLCYMDQRKFTLARKHLASAATMQGRSNPDLLFDYLVASYYAGEVKSASNTLTRLQEIAPERFSKPDYLRAEAMVHAAMGDSEGANAAIEKLRVVENTTMTEVAEQRVDSWGRFYKTAFGADTSGSTPPPSPAGDSGSSPQSSSFGDSGGQQQPGQGTGGGNFADDRMVIVDVVLISTTEDANSSYGINLLKGLQLQFGNPLTNTPGLSKSFTNTVDQAGAITSSQTISQSISIPSITYSLNIADALNDRDEVIAKPSLVALAGQTSEFFSGSQVQAAAVSGGAGSAIQISQEVGVKLSIRPDFLPGDAVRLQIAAQRTFLMTPSNSVVFQYRLDTSKTNLSANVVLHYGETLVLGGLTEQETTSSNDGVPILRDIPGINMFFSQHATSNYHKSVLMLITPRRPIYSSQAAEARSAANDKMSEFEKKQTPQELRDSDWYNPKSTTEEARMKLIPNDKRMLQIQLGDIKFERWDQRTGFSKEVESVVNRLEI